MWVVLFIVIVVIASFIIQFIVGEGTHNIAIRNPTKIRKFQEDADKKIKNIMSEKHRKPVRQGDKEKLLEWWNTYHH